MTTNQSINERISQWLLEEAPSQLPDRVLRETFERTRADRQRRTLGSWRRFAMVWLTPAKVAAGVASVVLLAAGAVLLPRGPSVGGNPTPSPSETPTVRPTEALVPVSLGGQIAFERTVDGNQDIYLMNLDRTGLMRLTEDPAPDGNPGWSPDGNRIVFTRSVAGNNDLFVMNADGSDQTRLAVSSDSEDDGRFSPDRATIAYWRGHEGSAELRFVGLDGSNDRLVTHLEEPFVGGIDWTADGQAILFNRDLSTSGGEIDILRVEIASKVVTAITTTPGDDSDFALSPTGMTIAFHSDRGLGGISLMDVDGSNVRHVTGSWEKGYPVSWSPDGLHLAFSQPDGWLYLVRTDGSELIKWAEGGLRVAWRSTP